MALFNRHIKVKFLELGVNIGGHIEYSDSQTIPIQIDFTLEHKIKETPNKAIASLYNLKKSTREKISVENTLVEIESGYWPINGTPNIEVIYKGRTSKVESYKESDGVTTKTVISCGDGQDGYIYSRVNKSLAPGANSPLSQVKAIIPEFESFGISSRVINDVDDTSTGKPLIMHGTCRSNLNRICRDNNLHWNITDQKIEIFSKDKSAIETPIYVLNESSGLIGSPRETDTGLSLKCLMIPALRPGRIIRVESAFSGEKFIRIENTKFAGSLDASKWMGCDITGRFWNGSVVRNKMRKRGDYG